MEIHINEYTFSNLFGKHKVQDDTEFEINEIEIPIIQRDYAQGRKTDKVERVRERFLENIYNSIVNHNHLTLDFVYGEIDKDNKLVPLDGQQRLTTLFLLHWYASKVENIEPSEYSFLSKFLYYTRPSSRDYCKALLNYDIPTPVETLSDDIKNQPWFQYQWTNDPTINSMLVMIDAIHNKFKDEANLWDALVNEQLISFYFLPIDQMGLSDELYIKMNSRGKPLTRFEHFKAEFESMLAKQDEERSWRINRKFDIDWTDMLFPYRGENEIIDDEFMRYFFFVGDILCYQQGKELVKDEFKLSQLLYSSSNPKANENLDFLEAALNCWCDLKEGAIDKFFERFFSRKQYESGKVKLYQDDVDLFKLCCDNYGEYEGRNRKFTLNQTLMLYAVLVFLLNRKNITDEAFAIRIRTVRNLVWNSDDEIRADGQRNNMPHLLEDTKSIILLGVIKEGPGFNQMRKTDERRKIEWIQTHPDCTESLHHLEDHYLLYGCVEVVGLENHDNFDRFRSLFNNCEKSLISKALLTIGDYSQCVGWDWQLGTRNDSTWKDLFHPSTRRGGFENTKKTLNSLLNRSKSFDNDMLESLVADYLQDPDTPKSLFYYFLKYPIMLSDRYGMYFTYNSDSDCIYHTLKMNAQMKNGKTWNVFLLALNRELGDMYELGNYAFQGERLTLPNGTELDCDENGYIFYFTDGRESYYRIMQDENGIDTVDRIKFGISLLGKI